MNKTIYLWIALGALLMSASCSNRQENKADHEKYLAVQIEGQEGWKVMDRKGNILENVTLPNSAIIYENIAWIENDDGYFQLYNIFSPDEPLTDDEWYKVTNFAAGKSVARKHGHGGGLYIVDTEGNTIELPDDIFQIEAFTEDGVAYFESERGRVKGIIDADGSIALEANTRNMYPPSEGYVVYLDEDLLMFNVNKVNGNTSTPVFQIDPLEYDAKTISEMEVHFSDGLMPLPLRDEPDIWDFVDKTGKSQFTLDMKGKEFDDFHDGYAVVSNRWGWEKELSIIDKKGNVTFSTTEDYNILNLGNGRFLAYGEGVKSIIDAKGNEVCALDADYVLTNDTFAGNLIVNKDGYYFVITPNGKPINKTLLKDVSYANYNRKVTTSLP